MCAGKLDWLLIKKNDVEGDNVTRLLSSLRWAINLSHYTIVKQSLLLYSARFLLYFGLVSSRCLLFTLERCAGVLVNLLGLSRVTRFNDATSDSMPTRISQDP